jgi:AraC-like DNA-binding protein
VSLLSKPSPRDAVYPSTKIRVVAEVLRATRGGVALSRLPRRRWVSISAILDWYRAVARRTGEPWFAYRVGQRFHVSSYGLYGFAILSSTDFRQTVRFALQYHELATPVTGVSFVERQGEAVWQIDPIAAPRMDSLLYRFLVELQFGIHTALHRDVMGAEFAARELRVTYSPQADARAYQEEFGCPVRFRTPRNEFVFDAAWLNRPAELGDSAAFAELLQLCDQRLAMLQMRTGVAGRVRALVLSDMQRVPDFGSIAARLRMSERTLRRSLKRENHNFRGLLDELRRMLAIQYVRDTSMSIEDVAAAVGFADSANFRNAFRRWTGATPRQFRSSFELDR